MSNTARVESMKVLLLACTIASAAACTTAWAGPLAGATVAQAPGAAPPPAQAAAGEAHTLTARQQAIAPIGAAMAVGDMPSLRASLDAGLDAGLSISEVKEVLVQLYAYAGFPRSLNALDELMKLLAARKQRGVQDVPGREPRPVPVGAEMLALGTANQTRLIGSPVRGPLFDFAPAIDVFLKTHLFGDIFARDNLDWQSRELATVGALAAMSGAEAQLLSHVRVSLNVGLSGAQLRHLADGLADGGMQDAAARVRAALDKLA